MEREFVRETCIHALTKKNSILAYLSMSGKQMSDLWTRARNLRRSYLSKGLSSTSQLLSSNMVSLDLLNPANAESTSVREMVNFVILR